MSALSTSALTPHGNLFFNHTLQLADIASTRKQDILAA